MADNTPTVTTPTKGNLVRRFAAQYGVDERQLTGILKATCFKLPAQGKGQDRHVPEVTNEQMAALLIVADQYGLNPFVREIFAFPDKQGGVVPIVSVDGWSRIINSHPDIHGIEFVYPEGEMIQVDADHKPAFPWIECRIYRKGRPMPTVVREYFDEVYRPAFEGRNERTGQTYKIPGPWQTHPKRMHRHKALKEAGRVAFGFSGIRDEDEAAALDITSTAYTTPLLAPDADAEFHAALDRLASKMEADRTTLEAFIRDLAPRVKSTPLDVVRDCLDNEASYHRVHALWAKPKAAQAPPAASKPKPAPVEVVDESTGEVYDAGDPGPEPDAPPASEPKESFFGPPPWNPGRDFIAACKGVKLEPKAVKARAIDYYAAQGIEGHEGIEPDAAPTYRDPALFRAWLEKIGM